MCPYGFDRPPIPTKYFFEMWLNTFCMCPFSKARFLLRRPFFPTRKSKWGSTNIERVNHLKNHSCRMDPSLAVA